MWFFFFSLPAKPRLQLTFLTPSQTHSQSMAAADTIRKVRTRASLLLLTFSSVERSALGHAWSFQKQTTTNLYVGKKEEGFERFSLIFLLSALKMRSEAHKRHRRNERDGRHHDRLCTIAIGGVRAFLLACRNLRCGLRVGLATGFARTLGAALIAVERMQSITLY